MAVPPTRCWANLTSRGIQPTRPPSATNSSTISTTRSRRGKTSVSWGSMADTGKLIPVSILTQKPDLPRMGEPCVVAHSAPGNEWIKQCSIHTWKLVLALVLSIIRLWSESTGIALSPPSNILHPLLQRPPLRSEEHTSELQSRLHLVCRLLL